jgi:hypothetical protein
MYPKWKVSGEPVIPVMFVCLHGYPSDGYYIWGQIITADTGSPAHPFYNSKHYT